MNAVNLSAVDLNLLLVVATVLEERSATRAAQRLHVTQSAVSNALKRARVLFGDPLVVREARGLTPSPRAAELLPALRGWLEEARRLVANAAAFDPNTSTRRFTIACADAVAIALLEPILALLRRRAPRASLRLLTLERLLAEDALARGDADLLIGIPPVLPPGHAASLVYREPLMCIVRRDDRRVTKRLGLDLYASLPHVELALFGAVDEAVDRALARRGRAREVAVTLPHFATVPLAVLAIGGVATVGARLARAFASWMPLRVLAPPVRLAPIEIRQVWHRRSDADPAAVFLRGLVEAAGRPASPRSRARTS